MTVFFEHLPKKLNFSQPSLIQSAAIPLALKGKDILARARTGSGKTAAYTIPIVQNLLQQKETNSAPANTSVLILLPTKELCFQTLAHLRLLCHYCSDLVSYYALVGEEHGITQKFYLRDRPDIIISTPSRLVAHLDDGTLTLKNLQMIVIDEADLVLSYGYDNDLQKITKNLPKIYQAFLMSATLNTDVESLKKLVLHSPAVIKMEEPTAKQSPLVEFYLRCDQKDKYLILYSLISLKILPGKALFFVNSIEECYKLKLFFERFSVKSAVLNSELPQNSRFHILRQFNAGLFNYVIATDETVERYDDDAANDEDEELPKKSKKKKQKGGEGEYGISRGVDFQGVQTVINFDFPPSLESYIHRVGRTARGGARGSAVSFVVTEKEENLFEQVKAHREEEELVIYPYKFNLEAIEGLRYRVEDQLRGVTKKRIREARVAEIKMEIANSERLQAEGGVEVAAVKHDKTLQEKGAIQDHLKNIPSYLVPFEIPQDPVSRNKKPYKKRSRDPLKAKFGNDKHKLNIVEQMEQDIKRDDPEYEMERRFMKPVEEKKKRKRTFQT